MAITYNAGTNLITLTGSGAGPAGGTSWANAYDMEDVLAQCGAVVTKQGANAYDISARLLFESGVYFVSKSEFVELKPNPINPVYAFRALAGSHIRFGEYNVVDEYSYNGAFWRIYLRATTGSQSDTGNRIYGEFLCYGSNVWTDSELYTKGPHFVAGATIRLFNSIFQYAGYFWAANCNMQDVKWNGGGGTYDMLFATGYDYSFSGVTSIDCNYGLFFSSTTDAPVDVYNQRFQGCTYDVGLISTSHLIRVINSPFATYYPLGSGRSFKECYTFNVKVTDNQGTPIVGAMVSLKDVDGGDAFTPEQTVAGGVLPTDKVVVAKWFRHANQGGNKDYNNHTLKVVNGADETEYKITIDHQISEDVVLLPQSVASYDNIMAALDAIQGTGFVEDTHSLTNIEGYTDILDDATNGLAAIKAEVEGLDGAVMRGTDSIPTNPLLTNDARVDNLDVAVSTRADQNPPSQVLNDYKADVAALAIEANVQGYATAALNAYDPSTRAEATADRDTVITAVTAVEASVFAHVVEGALTFEQYQRIMFSVLAGLSSGGGTAVSRFRDLADLKDRIVAQVDASGNRTVIGLDGT